MVGKYVELVESYKSLNEALYHGGVANDAACGSSYFDSEELERPGAVLCARATACWCRTASARAAPRERSPPSASRARTKVPYFGICFGMQFAVIEFARDVAGLDGANSTEVDPATPHPVIDLLPEQRARRGQGRDHAARHLSLHADARHQGLRVPTASERIAERHRHRYEFNPDYRERLEQAGLVLSGTSPDGRLVEIVEVEDHPWFVACQFHPEFASTPFRPHPLLRRLRGGGGALRGGAGGLAGDGGQGRLRGVGGSPKHRGSSGR